MSRAHTFLTPRVLAPRILAVGLLAVCAGHARAGEPAEATAEAQAAETLVLNPLSALDKTTLDAFRDAPLFTPSRTRPTPPPAPEVVAEAPPPAPEPVEEAPAEPPTLKLSGIVQGPEGSVAFVAKDGETTVEQLRLGDQIDGWLVSAIDPASLKLSLDEREQEYRMFLPAEPSGASKAAEDASDESSGDDASSSDEEDNKVANKPDAQQQQQISGAQREMDAARRAHRDGQKRQRLNRNLPPEGQ